LSKELNFKLQPKALLTLALLSDGRAYHESEIEAEVVGNRASHYISIARKGGWEFNVFKLEGQTGSEYQLLPQYL
jgi:hypothetical protein